MQSTDLLVHEHTRILRALAILGALADRAAGGAPVERAPVDQLARFFKEFADRFHHAKEENELFPFMESKGMPRHAGPIAVMLHEHEQGRALVRAFAAPAGSLDTLEGLGRFADQARAFEELLSAHIMKENEILFPMGARMMNEADDAALLAAFARREHEVLGEGEAAKLHAGIDALAAQYL
jgi:hemerythrin-like domain-containing protein